MRANLLLLAASTVFALLLAEGITRLVYRELPAETWGRRAFCTDPAGVRIMRPNVRARQFSGEFDVAAFANSRGYRDGEWERKDAPFRVLVLGDSFAWGWGVPADSAMVGWIDRLPAVDAYNLAIPGDDLAAMYGRYLAHRRAIDPDLVVIFNYINDFLDIEDQRERVEELERAAAGADLAEARCASFSERGFRDWLDVSHLYRLVNRFRLQGGVRILPETHRRDLRRRWFGPDARLLTEPRGLRSPLDFYGDLLRRIERDQPTMVVLVPPAYRFDEAQRERLREAIEDWDRVDSDTLDRALASMCENLGVEFVSLVDTLESADRDRALYFERDGHLRPWAQAVAGRYVAEEVRARIESLTPRRSASRATR